MTFTMPSPIPSPCISICQMNAKTGLCTGCHRTIDEISNWSILNDLEKLHILQLLETRAA
jgi:uncharacterized protein